MIMLKFEQLKKTNKPVDPELSFRDGFGPKMSQPRVDQIIFWLLALG